MVRAEALIQSIFLLSNGFNKVRRRKKAARRKRWRKCRNRSCVETIAVSLLTDKLHFVSGESIGRQDRGRLNNFLQILWAIIRSKGWPAACAWGRHRWCSLTTLGSLSRSGLWGGGGTTHVQGMLFIPCCNQVCDLILVASQGCAQGFWQPQHMDALVFDTCFH